MTFSERDLGKLGMDSNMFQPKKKEEPQTRALSKSGAIHFVFQWKVAFIAPWGANNVGLGIPEIIEVKAVDG